MNVCTRWRCQVILIVDDVILSSIIALHSGNNNNTVYAFDSLIMPFLSHMVSGNEKNGLWLTLFYEVFGHPHATQLTSLSRDGHCILWLRLSNNVSDPMTPTEIAEVGKKNISLRDVIYNIPLKLIYLRNMIKNSSIIGFWCFQSTLLTK